MQSSNAFQAMETNPLMNGLLAIVKNEQEQLLDRDKATLSTKKDDSASSPMSGMTRPISADGGSPTVDFAAKRVGHTSSLSRRAVLILNA